MVLDLSRAGTKCVHFLHFCASLGLFLEYKLNNWIDADVQIHLFESPTAWYVCDLEGLQWFNLKMRASNKDKNALDMSPIQPSIEDIVSK